MPLLYHRCTALQVVPFPLVELQAKWVAQLLSQRCALPSEGEMREDTERLYAELEARGVPQDYTHCLSLPGVSFGDQVRRGAFLMCPIEGCLWWKKHISNACDDGG